MLDKCVGIASFPHWPSSEVTDSPIKIQLRIGFGRFMWEGKLIWPRDVGMEWHTGRTGAGQDVRHAVTALLPVTVAPNNGSIGQITAYSSYFSSL